jgi:uncharacterized protein (DUF885 family)
MTISLHEKERQYKDRISKKFNVIINYYYEDYMRQNPEEASSLGLDRHDLEIKDYSEKGLEKENELNEETKKKLRLINPWNLTVDEHIDYALLQSRLDRYLFDRECQINRRSTMPQLYLPVDGIYCMLFRTMKDEDRLNSIISRLNQVPVLIQNGIKNLNNPPRIWTETTISQMKSVLSFFKNLPDFDVIKKAASNHPDLGNKLIDANNRALQALEEYSRFLNVELIERSKGEFCIGRQAFDFYLKNDHFISYSSGYLNEMGYELLNKAQADMRALAAHMDKARSVEALLSELESEISPPEKLIETYKQLVDKTRMFVKDSDLVTFPEGEELKILETPAFLRDIIPVAAYYCLGPYETSNIGQFWVTPVKENDPEKQRQLLMDGHNLHKLPALVVHETYPGHHLQLMTAKKVLFNEGSSAIRRATGNELLIEGWAMYCEQMMGELGFYSEQQKMMALKNRLWRAVRVILDTELHTGRRSFNEAVAFMCNTINMPEMNARAEVIRYTMTPTQPLSYEIGRRLINQLKEKEKNRLRENFSLKEFHDKLLSKGSLPIKLIEEAVFHKPVEVLK